MSSDEFEETPFVGLISAHFIDGVLIPWCDCPIGACWNKLTRKACKWNCGNTAALDGQEVTACSRFETYSELPHLKGIIIDPQPWGLSTTEVCKHLMKLRPSWA